jgi:tetratricopeptide (TPR) repeat protein
MNNENIDNAADYNELGIALQGQGKEKYPEAIEQFEKADALYAEENSPDRKYPLYNWAETLRLSKQFSEAETKYREAIQIAPDYADAYNGLGIALQGQGEEKYPEAIEQFEKADAFYAEENSPDRKYPLYNWAETLRLSKQFSEAETKNREAIQIAPDYAVAYNGLGLALQGQGEEKYPEAIEQFEKADALFAEENSPDRKYPLGNWGWLLSYLEDYDGAVEKCRLALEVDQEDAKSHYLLGTVLANAFYYEEALEAFDRAIHLNSDDPYPKHNKAYYLFHLGRYKEGWKAWDDTRSTYRKLLGERLSLPVELDRCLNFATILGEIYIEREEAEHWYRSVLSQQSSHPEALAGLAVHYQQWINSEKPSPSAQSRLSSVICKAAKTLKAQLGKVDRWKSVLDLADFYLGVDDFANAKKWLLLARDACDELRVRRGNIANRFGTLYAKCEQFKKAVEQFK